jgi:DNA-binding HxlR family transcriptional regulator
VIRTDYDARVSAVDDAVAAVRPEAVRSALEIFSDPWSFAVLQEAFFGVRRFDELQRNLGISRGILAKRLRHLVGHEILERRLYQRRPDRFEYRLTERARELYPVFVALKEWGERWLPDTAAPTARLVHGHCGQETHPRMRCDHCGEVIRVEEMSYELAPAARTPRAPRRRAAGDSIS